MKKNYFSSLITGLFLSFSFFSGAQQCLLDSIHMYYANGSNLWLAERSYYLYDYAAQGYIDSKTEVVQNRPDATSPFANFYRYDYSYNYKNKPTIRQRQNWVNSVWQNANKLTYTYPAVYGDSVCTYELMQIWDAGTQAWINSGGTSYTYNDFNFPTQYTESINYNWIPWLNAWRSSTRSLYTYTAQGDAALYEWEQYDTLNEVWLNSNRQTYHYNVNGLQDTIWAEAASSSPPNNYFFTYRTICHYFGNGNLSDYEIQSFDGVQLEWDNGSRTSYTYNALGKVETYLSESWDNATSQYVPLSRSTYTYDAQGNQTGIQIDNYNSPTATWVNGYKYTYTFDALGNRTLAVTQVWSTSTMTWNTSSEQHDFYDCNGLDVIDEEWSAFEIYPNPIKNSLHVQSESNRTYTIFTLSGEEIMHFTAVQGSGVDVSHLATGLYVLQNDQGQTAKFIKE